MKDALPPPPLPFTTPTLERSAAMSVTRRYQCQLQPGDIVLLTTDGVLDNLFDEQVQTDTYIHTCIHTYIHTCIHAYIHACTHTCIHAISSLSRYEQFSTRRTSRRTSRRSARAQAEVDQAEWGQVEWGQAEWQARLKLRTCWQDEPGRLRSVGQRSHHGLSA